jgi:ParB-like chromosome segregation protein Spo0J
MTRKARLTFTEGWAELLQQVQTGKPMPAQRPELLPAHRIKLRPEVFQQRSPLAAASEAHVRELTAKAKTSRDGLDPVTVWWDGKHWVCIDGHHRLRAYLLAGMGRDEVPVRVFDGSAQQALKESAGANTKDKLQMRSAEKSNAAWHLVMAGEELTQGEQADASGVSRRLVVMMHGVKRDLLAKGHKDIGDLSWEKARRLAAGSDAETPDYDDAWLEEQARKVADKLHKHVGIKAAAQVEVFAKALEMFSERLARDLAEHWREASEAADETF